MQVAAAPARPFDTHERVPILASMSWRQNRLLLSLVFLLFGVAGFVLLFVGDSAGRIIGLATLAMFGVGGLAWWIGEFRTERAAVARLGSITLPGGAESRALVLPVRTGKQRTAILVMAAFAVGALIIALSPEPLGRRDGPLTRTVMMGVALLLAAFVIRGIWGRRLGTYVALTPIGITNRTVAGRFTIPWQAIASIHMYSMHGQQYLGFDVADERAIQNDGMLGSLDRLEHPLTGNDRSIWLGGFAAPPEEVANVIRRYLEDPAKRASLGRDAVPEVLRRSRAANTSGITTEEKRHAREVARWVPACLLALYGVFLIGILVSSIENLTAAQPARGPAAVAVTLVLDAILGAIALAHFAAAVAVVLRRESGRKVGIGLSVVGIAIGFIGAAIVLATGGTARAWSLVLVLVGAYTLLLVVLLLVGDLRELKVPPREPSGLSGTSD